MRPAKDIDLTELHRRCVAGERDAMAVLYEVYEPMLHLIACRYVCDPELAYDVVHDGFVIIFTSIGSLRDSARLESWMSVIVKRLALKAQKADMRFVAIDEYPDQPMTESDDEGDCLSWNELSDIIDRLPDGYRSVFRLAVLEGMSHREIGVMLGIGEHSSSSQLSRAKAMLRRMVSNYRMNMLVLAALIGGTGVYFYLRHGMNGDNESGVGVRDGSLSASLPENISSPRLKDEPVQSGIIPGIHEAEASYAAPDSAFMENNGEVEDNAVVLDKTGDINVADSRSESAATDTVVPQINVLETDDRIWAWQPSAGDGLKEKPMWTITASCEGTYGESAASALKIIVDDGSDGLENLPKVINVDRSVKHHAPVVAGVSFSKDLDSRWSIETGLRYSLLRSDSVYTESDDSGLIRRRDGRQSIHYIGIPVKARFRIFGAGGFSVYGHAGIGLDIPLKGRVSFKESLKGGQSVVRWHERLKVPMQWSVDAGIGLQYSFTPVFGIFAEPSFRYYINSGHGPQTVWRDRPCVFTIPVGIRFSW